MYLFPYCQARAASDADSSSAGKRQRAGPPDSLLTTPLLMRPGLKSLRQPTITGPQTTSEQLSSQGNVQHANYCRRPTRCLQPAAVDTRQQLTHHIPIGPSLHIKALCGSPSEPLALQFLRRATLKRALASPDQLTTYLHLPPVSAMQALYRLRSSLIQCCMSRVMAVINLCARSTDPGDAWRWDFAKSTKCHCRPWNIFVSSHMTCHMT